MKLLMMTLFALVSMVRSECQLNSECPKYHFCGQKSDRGDFECVTHYTQLFHGDRPTCGVRDESGNMVADHSICEKYHRDELRSVVDDVNDLPSEYRCYPQLKYKCTYVFFMPCNSHIDCGPDFRCTKHNFVDGDTNVCVIPDAPNA